MRLERLRREWAPDWAGDVPAATLETLREGYMPEMPPLECGGYLIGYLLEVGPVLAGGMGAAPLTHVELEKWQRNVGLVLDPWECRQIHRLSRLYAAEVSRAEKRGTPPPWVSPHEKLKPEPTAAQLALRALAKKD